MKLKSTSKFLTVALTPLELWYLAQFFGPGWIFGVDDPTKGLSKNEIIQMETKVIHNLSDEGIIVHEGGNQIRIDEIIGGMVYSCIHSNHLLVVKDLSNGNKRFFHFLPQWQLELCEIDGEYELTLFKERSDLFKHVLFAHGLKLIDNHKTGNFAISAKELELATYLFDSGKIDQAIKIFENCHGEFPSIIIFLQDYIEPNFHLCFDLLLNCNDDSTIHTVRNELLSCSHSLYWVSHDEAGEEAIEMLHFSSVLQKQAEERFNLLLPKDM